MATAVDTTKKKIIDKVSYELILLADSLAPSPELIRIGKDTLQKVFTKIQSLPNFSVNRCLFGGSVGKKTSVLYPDFDAVVFLNKKMPPLYDEVEDFHKILTLEAKSFGIIPESMVCSGTTVTAEFENGVEMDLLPASCFSQDPEKQIEEVYKLIAQYPEKYQNYSSSLADIQIRFMTEQDGPTHQLIRLVKFWYKTLTLDDYIYGGSYLMEVLSVTVCIELARADPSKKSFPMFEGFKAVLNKIAKIFTLKIAYLREKGKWKLLKEQEIAQHKKRFSPLILSRTRYIIDPSNPYNDLVKNLTDEVIDKLKVCATKMLKRIEKLETVDSNELKDVEQPSMNVKLHVDKIFEPLSLVLKDNKYAPAGIPSRVLVHYDYQSYKSFNSKTTENKKGFFLSNKEAKKVSKTVATNLMTLVRGKARREGNRYIYSNGLASIANKKDVKLAVGKFLDENFTKNMIQEGAANDQHKNCDVTLYIPYHFEGKAYAIRFSMKWS